MMKNIGDIIQGKKSLKRFITRKTNPEKAIRDYYDTITYTKTNLLGYFIVIEDNILKGLSTVSDAVSFVDFVAKDSTEKHKDKQTYFPFHTFLYYITRITKPSVVVETGVERGSSAFSILNAMEKNGKGYLHSIELCSEISNVAPNKKVPLALMLEGDVFEPLKKRWFLHIGNSMNELPKLQKELAFIDMFVSGSDHNYPLQKFELETAKEWVRKNSIIVCDRPDYNSYRAVSDVFPDVHFQILPEKSSVSNLMFTVIIR